MIQMNNEFAYLFLTMESDSLAMQGSFHALPDSTWSLHIFSSRRP